MNGSAATLFLGGIRPLPPENRPTGIFKHELLMPTWLGREGLVGDAQADRRVHGGPDKALHQFPVAHYARLAECFPEARELLLPGSIGENLSVHGWDETNVCIGDRFRLGDAVVEVTQPRSPCWKIDARFGVEGMARWIEETGCVGWYFRVIEEGSVEPACDFELVERPSPDVTVARLLYVWREHRPAPEMLQELAHTPRLSASWVDKLQKRFASLLKLDSTKCPASRHS
jgi:MOSC domain-containing protein YiiM